MEHQNTKEQIEEMRKKPKMPYSIIAYTILGLVVFSGSVYYTLQEAKQKVEILKLEKTNLAYQQKSDCAELKRELENLVRKELFQQSYKNQQENIKDGIFMYSQNETNSTVRQEEIKSSLDTVCKKNEKRIDEINNELNKLAAAFAH